MVPLIILLLVLVLVVFPIWAIIKIASLGNQNDAIASQLRLLETQIGNLRQQLQQPELRPPVEKAAPQPTAAAAAPLMRETPPPIAAVPPLARPAEPEPKILGAPPVATSSAGTASAPMPANPVPSVRPITPPVLPAPAPRPPRPKINWEQFMGVKLFAWLGGLAAFLALAFFVKYSVDHNWIPPEVRAALGFLFAIGLVIGGLKMSGTRYAATWQTLIATGVVSLYAVTFACNSVYKFAFFQAHPIALFLLMILITTTAFLLAVRLEARVIAILGMLGGFLTPILLSTGHDNPPGLFGYIALLDIGLIAVALHRRWHFIIPLGAAGTVLMQIGWANKFLTAEKAPTAMVVCLGFCALFLAAYETARRLGRGTPMLLWSTVAFPFVAFCFAITFLFYPTVAARPGLLFTFVLLADAGLLAIAWLDEATPKLHLVAGMVVFALLGAWTGSGLTTGLLPWGLAFYLLYAVLHTAFPILLERHRPNAAPTWWSQLFPPLALLLMFGPLLKLDAVSLLFWPCVLLVDLIAIGLALVTASLASVAVVLILTLVATGFWIFNVPATVAAEPSLLLVIGGFTLLFFAAGTFLARKLGGRIANAQQTLPGLFGDARAQIPAFSALLPFLLLIMMTQRLPLANPSPVFGLALLLGVLALGLSAILTIEWMPACALAGIAALEYAWRARHFTVANATLPLAWYLLFYAVFTIYPFLFRRRFAAMTGPWAIATLAGIAQFPLVHQLVEAAWPNPFLGLVPALFSLPPLISLVAILRLPKADERVHLNQLAWFGGVALLFITLIFPIQFDRQWLTLGWALEGAALLWLFHRVPHAGLRASGFALLIAAFARLALNPAVLEYHARSPTALLNWFLYSYGIVIACLFVGARLLAPPRERVLGSNAPAILNILGTVLAFLLLNIEIADFFSAPGSHVLTFQFSGNFARDMTYTIAWALFALGLLLVCIWKKIRPGRYAALALLGVALLKLFLHDLAQLEALYRIGALFAVAVIAIVASFAYQRFLPGNEKHVSPKP